MKFFQFFSSILLLILNQKMGKGYELNSEFSLFLKSRELLQTSSLLHRSMDSPADCMTTEEKKCIFPFLYKGESYNQCTNAEFGSAYWCATSLYDSKEVKDFGLCQKNCSWTVNPSSKACQTSTAKICVFPFKYNNKEYRQCTSVDNNGVKWCATSVHDSLDAKGYGNCLDCTCSNCTVSTGNEECLFPFIYKGYTYYRCTDADFDGKYWCATSRYSTGEVNNYGLCQSDCVRTPDVSSDVCQTKNGQRCIFPFKYNGQTYHNCTTTGNNNVKWCATSLRDSMEYLGYGDCLTASCG
ncbi:epididymal sperm-binding protein 1 [Lepeophtheirus salmonis]|uniref:epididymal sperm-binding protein 1 n=1 Tax=Lepeophtheirus salmonis TaxID=72036 RepID=UPI001AE56ABB|nr:matrix metalloproteinase-9-like [Lepeophtheirus salmonis]